MKIAFYLIFLAFSCTAMEKPVEEFSRLERLPTELKLEIIKKIIHSSTSAKQAVEAVRTFIAGDRLLRDKVGYIAHRTTIEDHLGWHWNDERPMALTKKDSKSKIFKSLIADQDKEISNPELKQQKDNFVLFCTHMAHKWPLPENLLATMDLHHCYRT